MLFIPSLKLRMPLPSPFISSGILAAEKQQDYERDDEDFAGAQVTEKQ